MKIRKILKLIGKGFLILLGLLLLTGIVYEQIGRFNAKQFAEERTGRFVDVGGHELYYEKKGDGNVTVVFESGAPGDHRAWENLSERISKYATTVTYDRAGLLWSERGSFDKNPDNISKDLQALLKNIDFKKPYVLVGHSAAGIYLRPFINKHQEDILGVVLIDPSHPDQLYKAPEELKDYMQPPFFPPRWLFRFLNVVGLLRLLMDDPLLYKGVQNGGVYDEIEFLMKETSKLSASSNTWKVPLVVISAGSQDSFLGPNENDTVKKEIQHYWDGLQKEISKLSISGTRIVAEKSGHNMLNSESELISNEIIKMINLQSRDE
ncbi:MAG: alpha/beta hydrolase [Eudoraea sp.]|uniref:alpha/beta fold hydrolase n=1 Tax=Eudoraea sp. TaxID=1979955 RepID=UPI003C780987